MTIDWKIPVGEVAELFGGGTPLRSRGEFFGGDIAWVTPSDLPTIGRIGMLGTTQETLSQAGLDQSSAKLLPPKTVLFSSRATIGKIAVADRPFSTNQGFINFVPDPERLDEWYLAFYLLHALPEIRQLCGETTFKEVPRSKMRTFGIPDVPVTEQCRVVSRIKECLTRVEEIQRLRQEAETEKSLLLSATLRELFDEAVAIGEPRSIGDVTLASQYGTNVKCSERGGGIAILRIPNVLDGHINLEKLKFANLAERERAKVRLVTGDLIVVRTNGSPDLVGRCAVFKEKGDFGFASYLIRFRFNRDDVLPDYVSLYLQSPQGRDAIARIRQTSAGQYNVNSENLRKILFPLIKPKAQAALVEKALVIQRMAKSIGDELEDTETEAERLGESILREAFSGNL